MLSLHGPDAPTEHDGLDPLSPLAIWELEAQGAGKAWSMDIRKPRERDRSPSLLSTCPVPQPTRTRYLLSLHALRLTSQDWLPKLVAIVRCPVTGLNGNLQGLGKVPRVLEAQILPGKTVTWEGRKELNGP